MTKDDPGAQVEPVPQGDPGAQVDPAAQVDPIPQVDLVPQVDRGTGHALATTSTKPADDRATLTRDLTGLVRGVPGVAAVYSSGPLVVATLSAVTQVVVRADPGADLVSVSEANGGLVVSVTIGVSEGTPATRVCRQVYDAIAEHLVAGGRTQPATIAVKVGRIG